jgi:transposase
MDAILFVLRTGCQWNALDATNICSCSSAYRRFREWTSAGVFEELWKRGLLEYDKIQGIDWSWLSMDGAMTKAPLGGEKNRAKSYGSRQRWSKTEHFNRSVRNSAECHH